MGEEKKTVIVLVDDDADVLAAVGTILEATGFDVKTASSGEEGLSLIRETDADLILCDLMMETVDAGIRLAGHVKDLNVRAPFYMLSSVGDATNENVDIRELGIDGTIQKPVDPEALIAIVRNAIGD